MLRLARIDPANGAAFVTQVSDTETRLECLLNNNKNSDFCAPLTSFDWNEVDPNLLGKNPLGGACRSGRDSRWV